MKKFFILVLLLHTVSNALSFENNRPTVSNDSCALQVRITDSEINSFGLNIQIVNVEVYSENSGWITLNNFQQNISSFSFTSGNESLLANAIIPQGVYTKVRLTFGNANTLYSNTTDANASDQLTFASNEDKKVEIDIQQYLYEKDTNEVLLHFDVSNSISFLDNKFIIVPDFQEIKGTEIEATEKQTDMHSLSLSR